MSFVMDLFPPSEELAFRRNFATQFLASWCAVNFADFCARDLQERLQNPPVEDAEFLAGTAWEHLRNTIKPASSDAIPRCIDELTARLVAKGDVFEPDPEWQAVQHAIDALKAVEALRPSAPSAVKTP